MKSVIGILLGFIIGFFCRYAGIPSPAPPVLPGALLVLAMTIGYLIADRVASYRAHTTKHLCGGPTGKAPSADQKEKKLMEMLLIGITLGLGIGFCCRWFDIPLPSPPNLVGALLVVSMTFGFVTADYVMSSQKMPAAQERLHE